MRVWRTRWWWLGVAGLMVVGGCTGEVIREGLAGDDPGRAGASVGEPPVPVESLEIVGTGMSPVATAAMEPDAILPTMDRVYKTRKLPAWSEGETPWTRGEKPGPMVHEHEMEE